MRAVPETMRIMPEGARRFVEVLVAKYGDNYAAMARAHKLNYLQHTPKQLRHKVELYERVFGTRPSSSATS